jgi:hypothetical protein
MIYNYTKEINASQLEKEIRQSSITVALDYINSLANDVSIHFKASLSSTEESLLDDIVDNHIPQPVESEVLKVEVEQPKDNEGRPIFTGSPFSDAGGFRFRGTSFKDTVSANTTKDIDFKIEQERWINGGRALIDNIGEDDRVTFQVVDKDNVLGFGAGVVLDEFISGYYIPTDGNLEVRLAYPARIIAGLYIRLKYTSTHASGCTLKCNLYLHWKAA